MLLFSVPFVSDFMTVIMDETGFFLFFAYFYAPQYLVG